MTTVLSAVGGASQLLQAPAEAPCLIRNMRGWETNRELNPAEGKKMEEHFLRCLHVVSSSVSPHTEQALFCLSAEDRLLFNPHMKPLNVDRTLIHAPIIK